ncbi:retrovirus-related pol polyprotein from transposon TNT 1-94 [Tanacetum coccineum]|uniref:Retrovirus-related pol polyprotein from transposon TNT 1-94 n=1 Tax=Tanacetum coccineum TaxID=301880 RepID=A0ABQ5J285_9ASTR
MRNWNSCSLCGGTNPNKRTRMGKFMDQEEIVVAQDEVVQEKSIDQGPFQLGVTRDTLGTTPKRGVLLGPERARTYDDLNDNEKKRFDADVRATNIVLQGLPKDTYKLINHNIEAKAIWDNVKMLLAGSELTKEDIESQLYDEFERFKMLPGENINEYYVRFVTIVKLNKGLKETNHEQLYAYLKQHEKHAAQDRLIIERITPLTNDLLAFVLSVQPYSQPSQSQSLQYQSSTTPSQSQNVQSMTYPQFAEPSSLDTRYTQTDEILNTLTKQFALLTQSFRATLPLTNNQLRTSSNTRNLATIQDGFGGTHNRARNPNAGQGKPIKCYNCNGIRHIARNCTQPKRPQNSDYFKDRMLLMQAQENGAVLDEEELLFLVGEQPNTFDADVDNQPVRDLARNEDNIFQADECDAFDSDVDDEPTAQSIFMANLSSARPTNLQASSSDTSILSEVPDLENANVASNNDQVEQEIHSEYSEIAIGAQNPFYLRKAKVAQPTLYDGNEIINPDHDPTNVPSSEEDLELAELARQKMHEKMNDPVCVEKRIKYIPPNFSKENFLATLTPQTQLTPEQVFLSIDLEKRKAEELKAKTPPLPVLPPATLMRHDSYSE